MINPFYTFFIEASQHLLNHWVAGSRHVLALLGAGGKRRPTPAVVDPAPGGRILLSERQGRLLEASLNVLPAAVGQTRPDDFTARCGQDV
jgi:hypothetical protein